MSGKWKKIIWAVFMLQLCVMHAAVFLWFRVDIALWVYRVGGKAGAWTVLYIWLGITFLLLTVHFLQYQHFRRKCIRKLYPVDEIGILDQYHSSCRLLGIQESQREQIYFSQGIGTPFVLGFLRPLLLLPHSCKNQDSMELILIHECIHLKNKDTWYKLFLLLGNCLLWFQPLAYFIRHLGYRDMEVACDEEAVHGKTSGERYAYGQFLLKNLQQTGSRELAYSAFFCNGKRLMKARIAAVMEENKRWNGWAAAAVVLMLAEVTLLGAWMAEKALSDYRDALKPYNIYEGYERPGGFSTEVLDEMLVMVPENEDVYYQQIQEMSGNQEEFVSFDQLPYEAYGPWQVRVKRMSHYADCLTSLFTRYLYFDLNQEWASQWDPETNAGGSTLEVVYQRLLAGDSRESVWGMIFRDYLPEGKEPLESWKEQAAVGYEGSARYIYYSVALHVKKAEDYVYELVGVHRLNETLQAYSEKYPQADFSDVPKLEIRAGGGSSSAVDPKQAGGGSSSAVDPKQSEGEQLTGWQVSTSQGELRIMGPGADWESVPIPLDVLFSRGDEMDGKLNHLQEGSYHCDDRKQIFAYGGDYYDSGDWGTGKQEGTQEGTPVSVKYYDQEAGGWVESVVTTKYFGGRKLFVSFPEDSMTGFLIMTGERVMHQEATLCFKTTDGGKSWQECGAGDRNGPFSAHSLTLDGGFVSNQVGFLTIQDSERPDVLRTGDGGENWERVEMDQVVEYYGMAYAPVEEGDELVLYAGMEGYGKYEGTQARYLSQDEGRSWKYDGLVVRK